jgi:FkbM family methyltransferase
MAEYIEAMHGRHAGLLDYAAFLPESGISRIEITDGRVVLTCRETGLRFRYADPEDRYGALTLLNLGGYEPVEGPMLFRCLERLFPGATPFTFLDVGANGGWYALNVAVRFPASRVHAFEPVPGTFRSLEGNLAENALANVQLHNLGLLERAGRETFYVDARISGRASARNLVDDPAALPVACEVERMDAFCGQRGLRPDVIKLDVEGAELSAIRGGLGAIAEGRPLILAELLRKWARRFGYHPDEVIALLAGLGYRCHHAEGGRLVELPVMGETTEARNFFFLHRERHAALAELTAPAAG